MIDFMDRIYGILINVFLPIFLVGLFICSLISVYKDLKRTSETRYIDYHWLNDEE